MKCSESLFEIFWVSLIELVSACAGIFGISFREVLWSILEDLCVSFRKLKLSRSGNAWSIVPVTLRVSFGELWSIVYRIFWVSFNTFVRSTIANFWVLAQGF